LDEKAWRRLETVKAYRFAPAGPFGYGRAAVMRGGIAAEEIDPETMESRIVPGLHFIGEVLDVTGELGGYNFQWAFSSAAVCADAINGERRGDEDVL
jgi:predicted flavoprotein YhiN